MMELWVKRCMFAQFVHVVTEVSKELKPKSNLFIYKLLFDIPKSLVNMQFCSLTDTLMHL